MYRRVLLAGVTATAIIGAGGTALAVSGSDPTSGKPTTSAQSGTGHGKTHGKHGNRKHGLLKGLRRVAHGSFVTKGKDGYVTHDVINGTVTAVSATSVTVSAADKKVETFTVGSDTKVFHRTAPAKGTDKTKNKAHRPTKSTIAQVAKGDHVFVIGTGTSTLVAKRILDIAK